MAISSGILGMFARSPIRPMQQHMESAFEAASLLVPFFDAVIKEDYSL